MKMCLQKDQLLHRQFRVKNRRWETALQTPKSEKEEIEKVLQLLEQVFPCSPWTRPPWSTSPHYSLWRSPQKTRWVFLHRNCSLWRGVHAGTGSSKRNCAPWRTHSGAGLSHTGAEDKCEKGQSGCEESVIEKSCYGLILTLCTAQEQVKEPGLRDWSWALEAGWGRRFWFNIFFFSYYSNLF